ncbi:MAG: Hpt domain-containing protein [Alphaproteobacteria bacterium]|nr:Hpt domain-containing protein [Alphaproteobacteria bacterium]MBU0859647.1 Hpt domain-containing protein [Alphaproteobacteria bacterium]
MPAPNEPKGIKVEIYKLANHLKARMGARFAQQEEPGFIPPEAIAEADGYITALCEASPQTMNELWGTISGLWEQMRVMEQSVERENIANKIFTAAHEIKDVGAMCGYELAAHFAESLRDYIGHAELNIKAQVIIIQAHMDAIQIVIHNNLKTDAGPKAEELKKMVKVAIEKYK